MVIITWAGVLPHYSKVPCLVKFWWVVIDILHIYCNSIWTFNYISTSIQTFHLIWKKKGTAKKYFHAHKLKGIN